MRNLEEFNGKYIGKIGLILGSGPSLIQHLEFLKSIPNDWVSFAVNSAYVGCPASDFFVSDDWEAALWSYLAVDLRNSNKTAVLLYENTLKDKAEWFNDRAVLFRHRTGYELSDRYSHNDKSMYLQQSRNSVGTAIGIAHIMGLSPIVLLGVDCCRDNGYRWFWQYPEFPHKPRRLDGHKSDKYFYREGSKTDYDLVDILRYWRRMGIKMLEKCEIYNASPISILDVFPKVNLEEFIERHPEVKNA